MKNTTTPNEKTVRYSHAARWLILPAIAALLLGPANLLAWHGKGHHLIVVEAVAAIDKDQMPAFFLAGAGQIAHCALDPDTFTKPMGPPQLYDAEAPEHFLDVEKLQGQKLPPLRYDYLLLCEKSNLDPRRVGLLPYAISDWTQKLTVAFAEHRQWPDNPYIQQKCLVYAGLMSHYAGDLGQPLHTTIHYDGRARADTSSPRSGIHNKVDALVGKLALDPLAAAKDLKPAAFDDLMVGILAEFAASHALVDRVYELEPQIPAFEEKLDANSPVAQFTAERLNACARFTASLYLTAWKDSAKIQIPAWHVREMTGEGKKEQSSPAATQPARGG